MITTPVTRENLFIDFVPLSNDFFVSSKRTLLLLHDTTGDIARQRPKQQNDKYPENSIC
jgi:hypothetical protein